HREDIRQRQHKALLEPIPVLWGVVGFELAGERTAITVAPQRLARGEKRRSRAAPCKSRSDEERAGQGRERTPRWAQSSPDHTRETEGHHPLEAGSVPEDIEAALVMHSGQSYAG